MPFDELLKAKLGVKSCVASSDTLSAKYTATSALRRGRPSLLDRHRSINALAETINGLFKAEVIHL
tara:strand:- start:41 stop:238 length:198 start_codon:yes stop_codon:yes gene_type:complete